MTQKERNLLVQDICARFPYGVIAKKEYTFVFTNGTTSKSKEIGKIELEDIEYLISGDDCVDVLKPYLRPMSSMTKEEKEEYNSFFQEYAPDDRWPHLTEKFVEEDVVSEVIDWLNAHHFDYRGLIEKCLAISTEKFNPYKD